MTNWIVRTALKNRYNMSAYLQTLRLGVRRYHPHAGKRQNWRFQVSYLLRRFCFRGCSHTFKNPQFFFENLLCVVYRYLVPCS